MTQEKFPCKYCQEPECPLDAERCLANNDISKFLIEIPQEQYMEAYDEYLVLTVEKIF